MKWKTRICIRYIPALLILASLIACSHSSESDLDKTVREMVPVSRELSPLETKIHAAIIDIETKEIEAAGVSVLKINIDGMEVINASRKDYFLNELRSQQEDFKNYMNYLDRVSKSNNSLNDPLKRRESQAKHDAVVAYLETMIRTASSQPDIYKIVYYLKADTKTLRYDQTKTTWLDKDFKKVVADYSHLKAAY